MLYLHGGGFLHGTHRGTLFGMGEALLAHGIAVASAQYRLIGEARFPAPLHDVASAIRWLRAVGPSFGIDPDRIGVMGESAGAHLAAFAGLNTGDPALEGLGGVVGPSARVQACVGWFAVTDFSLFDDDDPFPAEPPAGAAWPEAIRPSGAPTAADLERWASPVNHVGPGAAPMLLLHGDADAEVSAEHSATLAARLVEASADATFELVPGAGHVWHGVDPEPIVARTAAFFVEHLVAHPLGTQHPRG